jgi:hypothetical protein
MGLSIDRAIRAQQDAKTRLADVLSNAEHFGVAWGEVLAARERVLSQLPKGTPYHVRSYLRGYFEARTDAWYRRQLEWCLFIDGSLRTKAEVKELCEHADTSGLESPYRRVVDEKSAHCWILGGVVRKDRPFNIKDKVQP